MKKQSFARLKFYIQASVFCISVLNIAFLAYLLYLYRSEKIQPKIEIALLNNIPFEAIIIASIAIVILFFFLFCKLTDFIINMITRGREDAEIPLNPTDLLDMVSKMWGVKSSNSHQNIANRTPPLEVNDEEQIDAVSLMSDKMKPRSAKDNILLIRKAICWLIWLSCIYAIIYKVNILHQMNPEETTKNIFGFLVIAIVWAMYPIIICNIIYIIFKRFIYKRIIRFLGYDTSYL